MTPKRPETHDGPPLGAADFHVLLALVDGALYGYAIKKAVAAQSEGRVAPEIGSLYRLLARLTSSGLVEEAPTPEEGSAVHPGRDRKYYRLTKHGRATARAEAERLREVLRLGPARALLLQRETR